MGGEQLWECSRGSAYETHLVERHDAEISARAADAQHSARALHAGAKGLVVGEVHSRASEFALVLDERADTL